MQLVQDVADTDMTDARGSHCPETDARPLIVQDGAPLSPPSRLDRPCVRLDLNASGAIKAEFVRPPDTTSPYFARKSRPMYAMLLYGLRDSLSRKAPFGRTPTVEIQAFKRVHEGSHGDCMESLKEPIYRRPLCQERTIATMCYGKMLASPIIRRRRREGPQQSESNQSSATDNGRALRDPVRVASRPPLPPHRVGVLADLLPCIPKHRSCDAAPTTECVEAWAKRGGAASGGEKRQALASAKRGLRQPRQWGVLGFKKSPAPLMCNRYRVQRSGVPSRRLQTL
ncbi:hypothetical protein L227DRAFT_52427 [Lentinus tigrinus ALCF2SS1-6]|uniref:Uncharacterized protein n=1 Tax=Lentinus tigrinus ALCF2SS1-6 TaxID=1328759 RepID=A0A5C2RQB0_9APHY|nr:hypothetical protein L227DRAFT_52427 [Lentinus tigrinus ALCF2SS1-6]